VLTYFLLTIEVSTDFSVDLFSFQATYMILPFSAERSYRMPVSASRVL